MLVDYDNYSVHFYIYENGIELLSRREVKITGDTRSGNGNIDVRMVSNPKQTLFNQPTVILQP